MSPPWMPLYIADYKKNTSHLSAQQHGAYLLLIMHYWVCGGLPDDDDQLARICSLSEKEWKRAKPILIAFFDAGWRHKRIEKEMKEAEQKYQRRATAGKLGGKAKAERLAMLQQDPSNALASGKQCSSKNVAMLYQPQPQSTDVDRPKREGSSQDSQDRERPGARRQPNRRISVIHTSDEQCVDPFGSDGEDAA